MNAIFNQTHILNVTTSTQACSGSPKERRPPMFWRRMSSSCELTTAAPGCWTWEATSMQCRLWARACSKRPWRMAPLRPRRASPRITELPGSRCRKTWRTFSATSRSRVCCAASAAARVALATARAWPAFCSSLGLRQRTGFYDRLSEGPEPSGSGSPFLRPVRLVGNHCGLERSPCPLFCAITRRTRRRDDRSARSSCARCGCEPSHFRSVQGTLPLLLGTGTGRRPQRLRRRWCLLVSHRRPLLVRGRTSTAGRRRGTLC